MLKCDNIIFVTAFTIEKTIIVWSVEVVITIFCAILQYKLIVESVIFAQVVLSLSLICGQIHNLHEKGK